MMNDVRYEGALIDLDGTVYLGNELIPGADRGIEHLRRNDISVLFLSNKPVKRRSEYTEVLTAMGVPATIDEVINSSSISAAYLSNHHPTDEILVVGEAALREELLEAGLSLTDDPERADVVLASMDREFDYATLTDALYAVDSETPLLATNPDRTCPTEDGEIPDAGAIIGAIEGATGETLDRVLGKPSQTAIDAATAAIGAEPSRCLMIGDRLETDIAMGNRAGMTTVLVRTGVTDQELLDRSDERPDHVIDSLADIDTIVPS